AESCAGSTHGDRGDGRARAPLDLEWLHHEGELEDAPGRKLVELQTLQQMYAVHHEHDLVDGKRDVRIRVGIHLNRYVVGADQHWILLRQPLGSADPDPGTAFYKTGAIPVPELAPTGVDDDRITLLKFYLLVCQRLLEVSRADLVRVRQDLDTLQRGHVYQHAASDERADILDAKLVETISGR